jgi:hypothetical protein
VMPDQGAERSSDFPGNIQTINRTGQGNDQPQ